MMTIGAGSSLAQAPSTKTPSIAAASLRVADMLSSKHRYGRHDNCKTDVGEVWNFRPVLGPENGGRSLPAPCFAYLYLPVYVGSTEMGSGSTTTYSSSGALFPQADTSNASESAAAPLRMFDIFYSCLSLQTAAKLVPRPASHVRCPALKPC